MNALIAEEISQLNLKKKRILIIDDDPDIIQFLTYNLQIEGYEVIHSHSGIDGLWQLMDHNKPDCILLDIMMPSPNGYEICEYLKSSIVFKEIPIVMISAKGSQSDIDRGLALGAEHYLTKPFAIDAVLKLVKDITCL